MDNEEIDYMKEYENLNKLIEELYNKNDSLEKINKEQALEIARLKEIKDKVIEYIKSEKYFDDYEVAKLFEKYDKILLEKLGDKENE